MRGRSLAAGFPLLLLGLSAAGARSTLTESQPQSYVGDIIKRSPEAQAALKVLSLRLRNAPTNGHLLRSLLTNPALAARDPATGRFIHSPQEIIRLVRELAELAAIPGMGDLVQGLATAFHGRQFQAWLLHLRAALYYHARGQLIAISHYADKREIDLIVARRGQRHVVEVKSMRYPNGQAQVVKLRKAIAQVEAACKAMECNSGTLIVGGEMPPLGDVELALAVETPELGIEIRSFTNGKPVTVHRINPHILAGAAGDKENFSPGSSFSAQIGEERRLLGPTVFQRWQRAHRRK